METSISSLNFYAFLLLYKKLQSELPHHFFDHSFWSEGYFEITAIEHEKLDKGELFLRIHNPTGNLDNGIENINTDSDLIRLEFSITLAGSDYSYSKRISQKLFDNRVFIASLGKIIGQVVGVRKNHENWENEAYEWAKKLVDEILN